MEGRDQGVVTTSLVTKEWLLRVLPQVMEEESGSNLS